MKLFIVLLLLLARGVHAEEPPRPLACLAHWYAVQPRSTDAGWVGVLPDGSTIPYDLGQRSLEEMLDRPALKDMFAISYETGPWHAIRDPETDPGRIRVEALFQATYGASLKQVSAHTQEVSFFGQSLRVHERAADPLRRVVARLEKDARLRPFLSRSGGTLVWRRIAGTERLSAHAYGIAVDLNPARAHYWRWSKQPPERSDLPEALVAAFEAEGFIWGGRWFHFDTMHFEWRPELLDPACRP